MPTGQRCVTMSTTCLFSQLAPGREVTFAVQGSNGFGPGVASPLTLPVKVRGGRGVVGGRLDVRTLASWLGLEPQSVTRVAVRTPRICAVAGSVVQLKRAGTCVVKVSQGSTAQSLSVRVLPVLSTTR